MFDFLKFSKRRKKELDSEGIRLLASIMVCFPEITTVNYEPQDRILSLTFMLKTSMDQAAFDDLTAGIAESLTTYHALQGIGVAKIGFSMDIQNDLSFLHVKRDLDSLTRGELSLLCELLADRFDEKLLLDMRGRDRTDQEFLLAQEDMLDRMLSGTQSLRPAGRLVGIREDDRVVVFDN